MADILEKGDVYYFYRPKVEAETPRDVQRFYMIMKAVDIYRLINIGGKELPGTEKGARRRRWAIITMVTETPETLKEVLKGGEYETKTRGTRHMPPAAPIAEGRYALVRQTDHAEFVHKLKREQPEEIEELFSLMREESFVLAVKNPDIHVKGFPKSKPDYPAEFENRFAGRRWIPAEGLLEKEFPPLREFRELHHGKKDVRFGAGGVKGGAKGGRKAAREAPSAAAVTKLLEGIGLPADDEELDDMLEEFWDFDRQMIHEKYNKLYESLH